jgi:outer membrane protein
MNDAVSARTSSGRGWAGSVLRGCVWVSGALLAAPRVLPAQTPPATERAPASTPTPREAPGLPAALTPVEGGLTATRAASRAIQTSFAVRAARANTASADAAQSEAALQMIPQINLSARYTRLSPITLPSLGAGPAIPLLVGTRGLACVTSNGTVQAAPPGAGGTFQCPAGTDPIQQPPSPGFRFPVILDTFAVRGSVTLPLTDIPLRLARLYQAAGLTLEARRLDEAAARSQVATDARVAFYEYMRGIGQLAVATQGLEVAQAHADDLRRFVEAGTVARVELMRVEAQVAEAERFVLAAREGVGLAEAQLRQRTHLPAGEGITLGEALDGEVPMPRNLADLLNRAAHDRPEIGSIDRQLRALEHNLGAVRAGMLPSVAGVFNVDVANPNQRFIPQTAEFNTTWDATIQVSWSPTSALVTNATSNRIAAQRDALQAQLEQLREGLELEVRGTWIAAQTAAAAQEAARRQLVAAEESYRVRRERFLAGAAISSDLTDAENDLLRARFAVVNANVDLREALARMRRAVGEREAE